MRFTIILDEPPTAANASFPQSGLLQLYRQYCRSAGTEFQTRSEKEYQKLLPDHTLCDLVHGGIFLILVLFHYFFISPQSIKKSRYTYLSIPDSFRIIY